RSDCWATATWWATPTQLRYTPHGVAFRARREERRLARNALPERVFEQPWRLLGLVESSCKWASVGHLQRRGPVPSAVTAGLPMRPPHRLEQVPYPVRYTWCTPNVYSWCMSRSRTNIEIDDVYVRRIMDRYGIHTKTEAVDLALRHLAGQPMTREEALAMEGVQPIGEIPPDRGPLGEQG